jgi:hypothetical protein
MERTDNPLARHSWWRTPLPGRPVAAWRSFGAMGAAMVVVALLLPRNSVLQARVAGIGLGVVVASIGVIRPAALWDHGRLRTWRSVFGDRVMWLLYIALGAAIVGGALFVPIR